MPNTPCRSLYRTLVRAWFCSATAWATVAEADTLKDAYAGIFRMGVAVNAGQFTGTDPRGAALVVREFDSVTPENAMKWDALEPQAGQFRFEQADRLVEFARKHEMVLIGHTLCWHTQLPAWVEQAEAGQTVLTKEVLMARLRRHIMTVAGRYQGKIGGWDVVNEAITDETGDYRPTVFHRVIGKEYLAWAFKWAHEADPGADLYYNDYNLDVDDAKRARVIELVQYLREQGAPIHGIGMQGHYNLDTPTTAKIDETIGMFAALGLKVAITELDVEVNRVAGATITGAVGAARGEAGPLALIEAEQQALANRYGALFGVFLKHRAAITRVTLWGLRDADSWRRKSSPLLFDDSYGRKPAYDTVVRAVGESAKSAK